MEWGPTESRQLRIFIRCCAVACIAIGAAVIAGWVMDVTTLKSIVPGFISMKFNTALGILIYGVCMLALSSSARASSKMVFLVRALAALATLIGIATGFEYATSINLGIDELVFRDVEGIGKAYPPGRLAPITALNFVLVGAGVLLVAFRKRPSYRGAQSLFFIVGMLSLQAAVGYALGIHTTFGIGSHTRIALHTAVAFILMSAGFIALTASHGLARNLFMHSESGALARRLVLAALLVPPAVTYIETLGIRSLFFDADFGILVRVVGSMAFFVVMIVINAERLAEAEAKRREALTAVKIKEQEGARLLLEREASERTAHAKSMFLANMSHEIRTPLNGIVGIADLLADSDLSAEQRKMVLTLQSSGVGLLAIINDILDFSKIEAGKMQLECVDFSLAGLLQSQAELLETRAREKKLALTIDLEQTLPPRLNGDAGRLGQILLNLISNAIKFTADGHIIVSAAVESAGPNGVTVVKFSISDTGIGLSEEEQRRLFRPFVQADDSTSRKYGGTGLGLSICYSLVNLMNGKIGVVSGEGRGSTFWFSVPLASPQLKNAGDPLEEVAVNRPVGLSHRGLALRVLVADDNVINQMVVIGHLKALGIESQAVANGLEVLAAMKIGSFDAILMDCQMPEMDGYEATRQLRAAEKATGHRIPIVALTANALREDEEKCRAAGMDAYLAKPFKRDALSAVLMKCLPLGKSGSRSA